MSNESAGRALADSYRTRHGLDIAPITDMFGCVHLHSGIDVIGMEADASEHGLSMLDRDTSRIVIAVALTAHPMRQRSSIAHELGHVEAGDLTRKPAQPGTRSAAEIRADAFARHLLLPLAAVRVRVPTGAPVTIAQLSDLVQEFGVSPEMAAIQMRKAGLIDEVVSSRWSSRSTVSIAAEHGWLSQYKTLSAASQRARAPQNLMARAAQAYSRGKLGINELAAWYGQPAEAIASELPAPPDNVVPLDDLWDTETALFPED